MRYHLICSHNLHRMSHLDCSVAQLEELRAECDKELNNARLIGDYTPSSPSFERLVKVIMLRSGLEALAKSCVMSSNSKSGMHKFSRIEHSTRNKKA